MTRGSAMLALLLVACGSSEGEGADTPAAPAPIGASECAACGMIVRDQPSPRGQLIHRDHTRVYFCSIADMLTYLEAPSPHGEPTASFVEANDPSADDPLAHRTDARPWLSAEDAVYVVGIDRERIMGPPVLVYERTEDAQRIAEMLDGEVRDFQALRSRPLPQSPPRTR